ncbi:MAG: hypothetical protein HYS12_03815 [Planctomycetes bacterium]|nr:hypothetical protein [Planctomycetota bacterium]
MIRIIHEAVVQAWELIRTDPPPGFNLTVAPEDEVTLVLHNTLVNRVQYTKSVPGFTPELFRVSREPKVYSFDARSLDKMPDLFFHLISDRTVAFPDLDGLYAECKPIDADHGVGVHYRDRGLWRFVTGDYAWSMREGMMIGYAVSGYRLPSGLSGALVAGNRPTRMPLISGPIPTPRASATTYSQLPHVTTHSRNFLYQGTGKAAPEITIHHLWLIRK